MDDRKVPPLTGKIWGAVRFVLGLGGFAFSAWVAWLLWSWFLADPMGRPLPYLGVLAAMAVLRLASGRPPLRISDAVSMAELRAEGGEDGLRGVVGVVGWVNLLDGFLLPLLFLSIGWLVHLAS